ncbi:MULTISPECIES: NTP/NDP exchange transporter [unclassified Achromobacter]|uniref:NTP/NDP exchange transporter n=1 Tax=unclassified Achromobacter TaxID=2626865 RepID=UPI000B519C56|nr:MULTISPECIES: MFS transporter [unclassified Achromobacter]OWT77490.1 MFS transporter [Achromobacter sp. HZ28]OWT78371.1 MFS transporter [Achromobacter sp. HZ34]
MSSPISARIAIAGRAIGVLPGEGRAALCGFGFFFFLFTGYFMLRPIRETLGIAAGVDKLQWLFTATFVVMLAAVPCFGWLARHTPRARFVTWAYGFFALSLVAFAAAFQAAPDNLWAARAFYVWISVFNLFVVSVAWSLMADVFRTGQAKRLFAFISAGASTGGLLGPVLGGLLAEPLGPAGLILLSAALLAATLPLKSWLMGWRARGGAGRPQAAASGTAAGALHAPGTPDARELSGAPEASAVSHAQVPQAAITGSRGQDARQDDDPSRPIGGGIIAGATRTFTSPLLLGISAFVVLLATASTFLYMEQARLVAHAFATPAQRIQVFSALDFTVQLLSLLAQLFLTGQLARRLGVTFLLTIVPLAICLGFVALAIWPVFGVLAVVMVMRRVGEYALVRPGREMIFTTVPAEDKYKAKNFIDTVVYRAGDAASAWVKTAVDTLGHGVAVVALVGALGAALWAICGFLLGRATDARQQSEAGAEPSWLSVRQGRKN